MKKRALTLMEIMIVIFLITLIGGAIGYNVKGSLSKGKKFKTEQAKSQLEDILELCLQDGMNPNEFLNNKVRTLKQYSIAKDPEKLLKDGEGKDFNITYNAQKKSFTVEVAR